MKTVKTILLNKETGILSITPDAKVLAGIILMSENNIGALPVLDGEELVGILSERDYARKVILLGRSSNDTLVRDIMSTKVLCVSPDNTNEECMNIMTEKRLRHLPVVDNGRIIGIISMGDVVKAIISEQNNTINNLEEIIHNLKTDRNFRNLLFRELDKV